MISVFIKKIRNNKISDLSFICLLKSISYFFQNRVITNEKDIELNKNLITEMEYIILLYKNPLDPVTRILNELKRDEKFIDGLRHGIYFK